MTDKTDTSIKRYFAWEPGLRGPTPVVYHGSMPTTGTGTSSRNILAVYDAPPDCFDVDGSPRFNELRKRFPPPVSNEA